jgi:signal peptidase II
MKRRQALAFTAILAACVGCDHAAKSLAASSLDAGASLSLLRGTLRLELVHNPGAFLSFGAGLPAPVRSVLFVLVVPLATAAVCVLVARSARLSRSLLAGLGLLAGGGLGNWLDRLAHGGVVTDFVSVGIGPLRTGIFNVADVCIVAGAALVFLSRAWEPDTDPDPAARETGD